MANPNDAVRYLQNEVPSRPDQFGTEDFERSSSTANEVSTVAEVQVQRLATVQGGAYDLDIVAYESFASDSTTGDTDTFNLAHYPMQTPSVAEDFVLYAGPDRVPASDYTVNWDANSFDYTGSETTDSLHAFYTSAQQTRYEVRKVAPNGTFEKLDEGDLSLTLRQNQNKTPQEFDFDHPLQGVLPAYWKLQIRVDGPYTVRWGVDTDGDGVHDATADQMLADIPIARASEEVPDWVDTQVRSVAGAR